MEIKKYLKFVHIGIGSSTGADKFKKGIRKLSIEVDTIPTTTLSDNMRFTVKTMSFKIYLIWVVIYGGFPVSKSQPVYRKPMVD